MRLVVGRMEVGNLGDCLECIGVGIPEGNMGMSVGKGNRRPVRSGALPENTIYQDKGCDVHPSCFTCPYPKCRYDGLPSGIRSLRNPARDARILQLKQEGKTAKEIANIIGVSKRTIFRVFQGQ